MRFIDEENLAHAIKRFHEPDAHPDRHERALVFRRLLRRFIDICDAVEYAHSRGVLHRDLKPTNVMIGEFGETLVIDWGLAKVMEKTAAARGGLAGGAESGHGPSSPEAIDSTLFNQDLGTVGYMSPEQAERRWDELGPTSDVYSLGATLYCLLVGDSAFPHQALSEFKVKVKRGEFLRPREAKGDVHPALEAVCLKAMALKPEDRYPSAKALAEEVERWLDDEPLVCYVAPVPARAAQWVRRHKPLATAAAALLLTATLGLAISNILIRRESDRARTAEVAAKIESARANRARFEAEAAREETRAALLISGGALQNMHRRFADEGLANVPGMEPLRKEFVDFAVDFADRLGKLRGDDPALLLVAGRTYRTAANIDRMVGGFDRAFDRYRRAQALLDAVAIGSAPKLEAMIESVQTAIDEAEAARMSGDRARAMTAYRNALNRAETLPLVNPIARFALARARYNLANELIESAEFDESRTLNSKASMALAELIKTNRNEDVFKLTVVYPLLGLGIVASETGQPDADVWFNTALAHLDSVNQAHEKSHVLESNVLRLRATVLAEKGHFLARDPARRQEAVDNLDQSVRHRVFKWRSSPPASTGPRPSFATRCAARRRSETQRRSGSPRRSGAPGRRKAASPSVDSGAPWGCWAKSPWNVATPRRPATS